MRRTSLIIRLVAFGAALSALSPIASTASSTTETTVCGTSVKVGTDVANTAKEYQSYLGLWTGDWSNGRICSGLIIKKIDSNGDAFVDYLLSACKGYHGNLAISYRPHRKPADAHLQ